MARRGWNRWWAERCDTIFPRHCVVCRQFGSPMCATCAARVGAAPEPETALAVALDDVVALFAYSGAGRTAVQRFKFDAHRDALSAWAHLLVGAVDAPFDVVTWIPSSVSGRRRRGLDQSELLARAVGIEARVPARRTLSRGRAGPQVGQDRQGRARISFAPTGGATRWCCGATVVVVDDIRTTGASLVAAAEILRQAGAKRVIAATIAATAAPGQNAL